MGLSRRGILCLIVFLLGCEEGANAPVLPSEDCQRPDLTWQSYADGFFRDWCTGCHASQLESGNRNGAPISLNFDNVYDVRDSLDRIQIRTTGAEPSMPPATGPTDEERELLQSWIECGTPD